MFHNSMFEIMNIGLHSAKTTKLLKKHVSGFLVAMRRLPYVNKVVKK